MAVRNDFTAGEVLAAADLNDTFASKVDYATPTNAQSGTAYTFVADDAERITTASNGSAVTFTIPPQSSVTWGAATILRVVNYGAGALTVAGGSGVTVTNTATVINQYGGGAAIRTGSDAWTFVPFGAGKAPFAATGGNEVATVGGYRYHLFTSSSTFVVTDGPGDVEIVVVGAGGGGGRNFSGGGGGGAIEPASGFTTQNLSAGSYTVTIASGGAGSTSVAARGATPSGTSFVGSSTITANGGGGGGSSNAGVRTGANGGSGGGGSGNGTANAGGLAVGSNTNAGGTGNPVSGNGAGGGGGATGSGQAPAGTTGGAGGEGLTLTTLDANLTSANFTTFSGMTVISSGGGGGDYQVGGGAGGTGAGDGKGSAAGDNATSFGSGGGGGGSDLGPNGYAGGNGYGGLVIVRYAV